MKTALVPGSFDPITLGHVSVIERASVLFDRVIVCVMVNFDKQYMFTLDERAQMAKDALIHSVAKCMIKSGRIDIIYEERLLKLMEIFRKHVDALSSFCSDDEHLIKILPDSLKHLERKLNGIF